MPRARERYERARDLGTMYGATESVEFVATEIIAGPAHVTEALQLPTVPTLFAGHGCCAARAAARSSCPRPGSPRPSPRSAPPAGARAALRRHGKYIAEVTGRESEYARDQVAARIATDRRNASLLDLVDLPPVWCTALTAYDGPTSRSSSTTLPTPRTAGPSGRSTPWPAEVRPFPTYHPLRCGIFHLWW